MPGKAMKTIIPQELGGPIFSWWEWTVFLSAALKIKDILPAKIY